jgi:hypothetical protein
MAYNHDLPVDNTEGIRENFRALKEDKIVAAAIATKLEIARAINGVYFDGTADINITQLNNQESLIITSSQTVIVPDGIVKAIISGCAAGGGGSTCLGAGGGSGQSVYRKVFNVVEKTSIVVTIGVGGSGNKNYNYTGGTLTSTPYNGGDGGDTSFGNYLTLTGGKGATNVPSTVTVNGGAGENKGGIMAINMIDGSRDFYYWNGGDGAGSLFGSGGMGGYYNYAGDKANGSNGVGFGTGGGGGGLKSVNNSGTYAWTSGGDGTSGIIMIEWK